MKAAILYLVIICVTGCTKTRKDFSYYTLGDFPQSANLLADTVDLGEVSYPKNYILMNDSLVVMPQTKSDSCYIHIINLNTRKLVYRCGVYGRGPNEFLKIKVITDFQSSPYFYIIDKGSFVEVNLDSLLKLRENYTFYKIPFSPFVNTPAICRFDSRYFLAQHAYYFDHKKYHNPVERFVKIDLARDSLFGQRIPFHSEINFYVANVNYFWLVANNKNNKLWCLGAADDRIDIFDKDNLQWIKTLKGPVDYSIQYTVLENVSDYPMVVDVGLHTAFTDAFATDSCIYVLFGNRNYLTYNEVLKNIIDKSEILKFDWEGRPLHRYRLDRYITNFAVDSQGKYFYCTAVKDFSLTPGFVKYQIEE